MTAPTERTRWRLNELSEENRERWTRVHLVPFNASRTLCGVDVPSFPYMQDWDPYIPNDAPVCRRCAAKGGTA